MLLRYHNKLTPEQISGIFRDWNQTSLQNYLLESTSVILEKKEGVSFLIDLILDKASHKGTGSWTTIAAAELGVAFTMSSAALNARYMSALKNEREKLSSTYDLKRNESHALNVDTIKKAYQIARIINHHQGFQLIQEASSAYDWHISLEHVASVWTNGCIIASDLMKDLTQLFKDNNTIIHSYDVVNFINSNYSNLKDTVKTAIESSTPIPCLLDSLNYINAMTQASGSGNMIQAQRDYFGAHTYKRIDDSEGKSHHSDWTK